MITDQFLDLYNEIDHHLSHVLWLSGHKPFKDKIIDCVRLRKWRVERIQDKLKRFWYIRNDIVHEYKDYLAVTAKALQEIQSIRDYLINPPLCRDCKEIMHAVATCQSWDSLKEVLGMMKTNQFTHIPVYQKQVFSWILSDSIIADAVSDLLSANWEIIAELTVWRIAKKDVLEYTFVSQNTQIEEIIDLFAIAISKKEKLGAVFITNLGKEDEQLLWIVTARDIPVLESYLI